MYSATIVADSISAVAPGARLTTMLWRMPRFILAEVNTHRDFSRNSASSRAIPTQKRVRDVLETPFIPEYWGANQPGMQAENELTPEKAEQAREEWLILRDATVVSVQNLNSLGVHKQLANRPLETFGWHTALVTSTRWVNFFNQRRHPAAQPEFRKLAGLVHTALADRGKVKMLKPGEWHLPFIDDSDRRVLTWQQRVQVSIARCARLSYETQHGVRDHRVDVELYNRLRENGHLSPFEHVATPAWQQETNSNFDFWTQARKMVPREENYLDDAPTLLGDSAWCPLDDASWVGWPTAA